MKAEKWQEIKRIFNEIVELSDKEKKEILENIPDEEIISGVENLLKSDKESHSFPDIYSPNRINEKLAHKQIGKYKLISEIGNGGMGTVFLAEREDFGKKCALKVIKHEFSTSDLRRRFENEREILASLEHPNIANLIDGGTTENGLPFFVMEFVEGTDLIAFCNENNLSFGERLKIFRKICTAVSYAHGKLIVHRDLKPTNILITKNGEPKLLDFGISKLLTEDVSGEKGTATALGMMTPKYASPEQFRGESVSTATDIYSLGVILFELLTAKLPYEIENKRLDEVAHAICETNPQKPSMVLSQQIASAAKTGNSKHSANRQTNPKSKIRNPKSLRGDLDNIILKTLRKEPDRRYSSVEKLSEDLRRHLEGLPVSARPDTFSYRAEKFFKRNFPAVSAAVLIFLLLIGGIAGIGWQYVRAENQRKIAEQRFDQIRELANNVVFKYHDEIKDLQGSTKVREMMVEDSLKYLDNLHFESGDDAALIQELAQAYMRIAEVQGGAFQANLGDSAGSLESYKKALDLLKPIAENSNDLKLLALLREAHLETGRAFYRVGDFTNQAENLQKSLDLSEKLALLEPQNIEQKINLARSYIHLAEIYREDVSQERQVLFNKALLIVEQILQTAPNDENAIRLLATVTHRLQLHYFTQASKARRSGEAEKAKPFLLTALPFARRSTEALEKIFELHPDNSRLKRNTAAGRINEGKIHRELGETDQALNLENQAKDIIVAIAANDPENYEINLDLKEVFEDIAFTHIKRGDFAEAEKNFQLSVDYCERLLKKDPENYEFWIARLKGESEYANALIEIGKPHLAKPIYLRAAAKAEKDLPKKFTEFNEKFKQEIRDGLAKCV